MGGDFGRHPVRPVVADDADDVAAAEAEFDHAEREVVDPPLIVVPGQYAPQPEILFAQRDFVAMFARVEPQQFWIGIGLGDAAGSTSAILRPKSSTMTRWEISISTPMSCSIIMTVMPNSSLRSTM